MASRLDIVRRDIFAAGFTQLKGKTNQYILVTPSWYSREPVAIMAQIVPGRQPNLVRYEFTVAGGRVTMFGLCEPSQLPDKVRLAMLRFEFADFFGGERYGPVEEEVAPDSEVR